MSGVTAFGVVAVTFMMVMYALERRHRLFLLGPGLDVEQPLFPADLHALPDQVV